MDNNNSSEPIILGKLRKEKSSKPIFVFLVFVLIIGITFGLPYIQKYAKNPNTIVGAIYGKFFEVDDSKEEDKTITRHTLNENTSIDFNNIILSNVKINNNKVFYDLVNKTNNTIILDSTNYYFNIYNSENELLKSIKLTGNITNEKTNNEYTFSDFKFKNIAYYGNVVTFTNYEDIKLKENDLGIANLTCSISNNTYKYDFNNLSLKSISHNYKYDNVKDINKYLEKYNFYIDKSKKINELAPTTSNTQEKDVGFEFVAAIDLTKVNISDLKEYIDYNYYVLDTPAKKVKYEMEAKGYKCL
ncbi:MAG: hypothetical protein PHF30_01895 [Bacilli bacterium]|nr:hypothetical protein [Bacilli bacterium]